jgi:uncharacterized protein YneF (UPF0154 family)
LNDPSQVVLLMIWISVLLLMGWLLGAFAAFRQIQTDKGA